VELWIKCRRLTKKASVWERYHTREVFIGIRGTVFDLLGSTLSIVFYLIEGRLCLTTNQGSRGVLRQETNSEVIYLILGKQS
jgi:hypothetical protein